VLESDEELIFELRHRSTNGDANIAKFRLSATDQPGPAVREIGPTPLEKLAKGEIDRVNGCMAQFLEDHEPYQLAKASLDRANAQLKEVQAAAGKLNVMVLAERKEPRDTHVLLRGVWDKKGRCGVSRRASGHRAMAGRAREGSHRPREVDHVEGEPAHGPRVRESCVADAFRRRFGAHPR
jgi:hypothetical protein